MTARILTSAKIARNVKEFVIPIGTTHIGTWAFWCCSGLKSITIPSSVTSIGKLAFWGCTNLTSVMIPNSVTTIGNWAFDGCPELTIRTPKGSYTESWAKTNKIKVKTF